MDKTDFFISERNTVLKQIFEAFLDSKFAGIIYGKPLTGKTFFVKNLLNNNYINYYYIDIQKNNLNKELNDLIINDYTVLVLDNIQLLSEEDLKKIFNKYKKFENLSLILIGNNEVKGRLTLPGFKDYLKDINFVFEFKELDFKEFKEFLKNYMSEKGINIVFTTGALKDLYKQSEGKIGKIIYLLYKIKDKKFVYKPRKSVLLLFSAVMLFLLFYYWYTNFGNSNNLTNKHEEIKKEGRIIKKQSKEVEYKYLYDTKNGICYNFLDFPLFDLINLKQKNSIKKVSLKKHTDFKFVYFINIGAFKYRKNAENLADAVENKYNLSPVIEKDKKSKLFKVRLKYYDMRKAKNILKVIKNDQQFKKAFLTKEKNE